MANLQNKRVRVEEPETESEKECPICLQYVRTKDQRFSFNCTHQICHQCDNELFLRAHDHCPTCRAWREGCEAKESGDEEQESRVLVALQIGPQFSQLIGPALSALLTDALRDTTRNPPFWTDGVYSIINIGYAVAPSPNPPDSTD